MNPLHFSDLDIVQMESRKRAAFMNSLTGFKSASLIGTIDKNGSTNLSIFSSVTHLGSNPALVGFINRPDSTERHTLENILELGFYTINHIHPGIFSKAHQTAARYPKNVSEFKAVGLTAEFHREFQAPFVLESRIKYGLEYIESHSLKINGTILVIGKVIEAILPDTCLRTDGSIDVESAETMAISGLDGYHVTNQLARLSYAKPETLPTELRD
jgi:flavin reductase (DIM6/NTAB) family NADH-FMN oxidoreductase RutF